MSSIDELSELIKFHRKQSGLTQKELADLAGVGKTVIYDIEKGKETTQLNTIKKILEVLNIKIKFESPLLQSRSFNDFLKALKNDLLDFAKDNLGENTDLLLKDGNAFIEKTKKDLKRWTEELALGKLNRNDFEFLLKGKKDLAEMEALKQLGLAKVGIAKLRDGIIDTIVNSAKKIFL